MIEVAQYEDVVASKRSHGLVRPLLVYEICPRAVHLEHETVVVNQIDVFIQDQFEERRMLPFSPTLSLPPSSRHGSVTSEVNDSRSWAAPVYLIF